MTFKEILDKYEIAKQHSRDDMDVSLEDLVIDILKVLVEKEFNTNIEQHKEMNQYTNDKLWEEIKSEAQDLEGTYLECIELGDLRVILEKYKILGDEKNGM